MFLFLTRTHPNANRAVLSPPTSAPHGGAGHTRRALAAVRRCCHAVHDVRADHRVECLNRGVPRLLLPQRVLTRHLLSRPHHARQPHPALEVRCDPTSVRPTSTPMLRAGCSHAGRGGALAVAPRCQHRGRHARPRCGEGCSCC
jgi:hypothetical protein